MFVVIMMIGMMSVCFGIGSVENHPFISIVLMIVGGAVTILSIAAQECLDEEKAMRERSKKIRDRIKADVEKEKILVDFFDNDIGDVDAFLSDSEFEKLRKEI